MTARWRMNTSENSMAVLVQPMLAADVGGVLFPIDPVTGEGGGAWIVEVTHGGAGSVAAGTETPAHYRLWNDRVVERPRRGVRPPPF